MMSGSRPSGARGFTLTELVIVIVIAGILSAIIYNRLDINSFKVEGTTDQVKAEVRYAHKLAVAQRRSIYISGAANTVKLCYDSGCTSTVSEPPGASAFSVSVASGVALTAAFYFDSLGRPRCTAAGACGAADALATSALSLTFTGGSRSISVEPQTGFTH